MAKLESGRLGLEIRFIELDTNNWIQYEIRFLYDDEPLMADGPLKRENEHWQKRSPGAFKANQYERDGFIPTLRRALETDEVSSFTPIDPDVTFVVYPRRVFPLLSHIREPDLDDEEVADRELVREVAGGQLLSDVFTIIFMVDVYNYTGTWVYSGQGPALILLTHRSEVREFLNQLEAEYAEFCARWGVSQA
ncbi:MAG TPA: hypothetical protein VIO36_10700 [Anaerolineaceae bacterium]